MPLTFFDVAMFGAVPPLKVKVKSSMAKSLPVENLLPQNVGSIKKHKLAVITEKAQWGTPSCSRPQPATDNGVRDGRSNWLVAPPTLIAVLPKLLVHSINRCSSVTVGIRTCNLATFGMRGNHLAYAATQGTVKVQGLQQGVLSATQVVSVASR